ncbi:MAG: hypothetical protein JWP61_555 [Friedmanniella sp.]|nr:hypothetical protein [Friedmanniella sp.]
MRAGRALLLVGGCALLLSGCAAGVNEAAGGPGGAGFWLGLWHGLISPVTFVISLFTSDVSIYEVHNNGSWYDAGFMLGAVTSLSGGAGAGAGGPARRRARADRRAR